MRMRQSRIYVFSDLDDTLIQTAGKLPDGVELEVEPETGAYDRNGNPVVVFFKLSKSAAGLI